MASPNLRTRIALVLAVVMAAAVLVPLTAGAHESCVADDAGDAPDAFDIGDFCVSGGDEDPVAFSMILADAAPAIEVAWITPGWQVSSDQDGVTTVTIAGGDVACDGAATTVTQGSLFEATVPAICLPAGLADVTAHTFDDGVEQDVTCVGVGGVPQVDGGQPGSDQGFTRLAGASRIQTAVAVAQDAFPDGSAAVLLANADNPVDALPASRSRYDGPILYIPSCGDLPEIVANEIGRLAPEEVVVLGGPGAICDDIAAQAAAAST